MVFTNGRACLAAFVIGWACLATGTTAGQEVAPGESVTGTNSSDSRNLQPEKPIPLPVLRELVSQGNRATIDALQLTEDQQTSLRSFSKAIYDVDSRITRLREITGSHGNRENRFEYFIAKARSEGDRELAMTMQAILTAGQRTKLRNRKRAQIQQHEQNEETQNRQFPGYGTGVMQLFAVNDLLAVAMHESVQDAIQLTDEQFAQLNDLQTEFDDAGVQIVQQCLELIPARSSTASSFQARENPLFVRLREETNLVLTERQREMYDEHVKLLNDPARTKAIFASQSNTTSDESVDTRIEKQKLEMLARRMQLHGSTTGVSTRTVDNVTKIDFQLNNFFADPVNAEKYEITQEQQTKIAEILANVEAEFEKHSEEKETRENERQREIRETVKHQFDSGLDKYNERVKAILTPEQLSSLEGFRYYQATFHFLIRPEIVEKLKLDETQVESIREILNRQRPGKKDVNLSSMSVEERRKHFEERQRNFFENVRLDREHSEQQSRDILAVLTEEQTEQWNTLTGKKRMTAD